MKLFLLLISLFLFSCSKSQPQKTVPTTEIEINSYALGVQIGKNYKLQKIDIDDAFLSKGIRDVLDNKSIDQQMIAKALFDLQRDIAHKDFANLKHKESNRFFTNNKMNPKVKEISEGIQLQEMTSDGTIPISKEVTVVSFEIEKKLLDNRILKSKTLERQNLESISPIIKKALSGMRINGSYKILIHPDQVKNYPELKGSPKSSIIIYDIKILKAQ